MADKNIGALPQADGLYDDSLFVVEHSGTAKNVSGRQFKDYAKEGVETYVESAQKAAQDAAASATQAGQAIEKTAASQKAAEAAQAAAEEAEQGAADARIAIENMLVDAVTLATGQPATVSKELVDGVVKLVFGLPAGPKGDTGNPGSSIQSITRTSGTGAPGTTDSYTITLTDGSTTTFQVYNGADGIGAGDFMANGTVPMTGNLQMGGNRITGLAAPVDDGDAVRKADLAGLTVTTDPAPTQGSPNPVQSGGVFEVLGGKQDKLTGTVGQVVGFQADGSAVAQDAPETGVISFNGRSGAVVPQAGDYTAGQVGARPSTWTPSATDVGALPITGGTLTGNLTLKGSQNYGTKINFGDGDYVHLHEISDDKLEIKATNLDLTVSGRANYKGSELITGNSPVFTGSISLGRKAGTTVGANSFAVGVDTTASGYSSHAEGFGTTATGQYSHAEGRNTTASGQYSHAEGSTSIAATDCTHAEGYRTIAANRNVILKVSSYTASTKTLVFDSTYPNFSAAFSNLVAGKEIAVINAYYYDTSYVCKIISVNTNANSIVVEGITDSNFSPYMAVSLYSSSTYRNYSHAEGNQTIASGDSSHAEGFGTTATGPYSHAEGASTTASGTYSHAEGQNTTASGDFSHAEGSQTIASGYYSHAEGFGTTASGDSSHAEGQSTTASGGYSHAEGSNTTASGDFSHAAGIDTIANDYQYVIGTYSVERSAPGVSNDRFIIGGGWNTRRNAFRVHSNGSVYGGQYYSSGADYAELFEWADGNAAKEDRAGLFVALDGDQIRLAGPEDTDLLGIVSAVPSVVGDVYDDQWAGMYLRDVFGRTIMEEQDFPEETGPDGEVIREAHRELAPKLNPDYDPTQVYLPRSQRPEWDAVGMMGKLVVVDDGTCKPNGYCKVAEGGIATQAEGRTPYRVLKRLDTNHVQVLIR